MVPLIKRKVNDRDEKKKAANQSLEKEREREKLCTSLRLPNIVSIPFRLH